MKTLPESTDRLLRAVSRRQFLYWAGGAAGATTLVASAGCGYFGPESCGQAFDPWAFPSDEARPEYLAVAAAILAANPHNSQPWKFRVTAGQIDLFADQDKSLGAMDGLHREMYIGLGCALENMAIAARHHGRTPAITFMPEPADETYAALVTLSAADAEPQTLYPAIPDRHTNRGRYHDGPAPAGLEEALRELIVEPQVHLTFIGGADQKKLFRDSTVEATRAIVGDDEMNTASHSWWRQTCDDIDEHRDGLTMDATGQGSTTRFFGKVLSAPDADTAGDYWISMTENAQATAGAYVVLSTPDRYDRTEQLACGRAYQRLHLWAVSQGLAMQPLNQMAERQDREHELGLEPHFATILEQLVDSTTAGAQMLFRIGYPWDEPFMSPRRPVEWVTL